MDTIKIREEISEYLQSADDRFVKLIYGMMTMDREENLQVPEGHKKIIRSRLKDYKKNPADVLSWEDVQQKMKSKL